MSHPLYSCFLASLILAGCQTDKDSTSPEDTQSSFGSEYVSPDLNGDGSINILVLGTSASISGQKGFSPDLIATELSSIFDGDPNITGKVSVVSEDIFTSQGVTFGLGQGGDEYTTNHYRHSLVQYYYWPEGSEDRMANLSGDGEHRWDYVVIAADPSIVSTSPG